MDGPISCQKAAEALTRPTGQRKGLMQQALAELAQTLESPPTGSPSEPAAAGPGPKRIDLAWKNMGKTCELEPEQLEGMPLCLHLGHVRVAPVQALLEQQGPSAWTADGNVSMFRRGHDSWGVKKVMLLYADDAVERVLQFPWWQKGGPWYAAIIPILQELGIQEGHVARMLLASMEPGVVIPVHHDTGDWVKMMHRVHVAVQTNETVRFLVGKTEDKLERIRVAEGEAMELNNQCKHAVWHQGAEGVLPRVHLIIDHIDPSSAPLPVVQLTPGETLQYGGGLGGTTLRRTADFVPELPLPRAKGEMFDEPPAAPQEWRGPRAVVVGAQKAATTSLIHYITQHPWVVPPLRKETHFFDWRWNSSATTIEDQRKAYAEYFDFASLSKGWPYCMTTEATPSYMLGGSLVLRRALRLAPDAVIVVALRDPVERARSQWGMMIDPRGSETQKRNRGAPQYGTFEEAIMAELAELQARGVTPECTPEEFDSRWAGWAVAQPNGGHSLVARGLYELQVRPWVEAFPRRVIFIPSVELDGEGIQRHVSAVWEAMGLPPYELQDLESQNVRSNSEPSPIESELRRFYAPFNEKLFGLIGKDLGWNVVDCDTQIKAV